MWENGRQTLVCKVHDPFFAPHIALPDAVSDSPIRDCGPYGVLEGRSTETNPKLKSSKKFITSVPV